MWLVVQQGRNLPPVCHSSRGPSLREGTTPNLLSSGPEIPRCAWNDKSKTSAGRFLPRCTRIVHESCGLVIYSLYVWASHLLVVRAGKSFGCRMCGFCAHMDDVCTVFIPTWMVEVSHLLVVTALFLVIYSSCVPFLSPLGLDDVCTVFVLTWMVHHLVGICAVFVPFAPRNCRQVTWLAYMPSLSPFV